MIKSFFKSICYLFAFIYLFVYFFPKNELYFYSLNKAQEFGIQVQDEVFLDNGLGFKINDANLFIKDINAANIESINSNFYIFSNEIDINNVIVSSNFKNFVPRNISNINIKYAIWNPLFVNIKIFGKSFKAEGYFDIMNLKLVLNLNPSSQFIRSYPFILSEMKKINSKEYRYEYSL